MAQGFNIFFLCAASSAPYAAARATGMRGGAPATARRPVCFHLAIQLAAHAEGPCVRPSLLVPMPVDQSSQPEPARCLFAGSHRGICTPLGAYLPIVAERHEFVV
ncbi:hypothetical protein K438DRAFT_1847245 [Mycena galopus ATCC 62051]|nr:hypothetical protein K438DRAFT_1847245 [Mycena galopus ATCC 62051]